MIIESKCCRLCNSEVREIIYLCDSPPANNFDDTFNKGQLRESFPLVLDFCDVCSNLQLRHCLGEDLLYSDYTYITPQSKSLETHYHKILSYMDHKIEDISSADVVEIGSNNGELLKFLKPKVSSVLGVDPAKNIAKLANSNGIETIDSFFNIEIAKEIKKIKNNIQLVIARHMFAHNSDPTELIEGMKALLGQDGLVLIENAYAIDTLLHGEFDQIYHEHMFFYSATSLNNFLKMHKLYLHDIFFSEVHGGSIAFIASAKDLGQTEELSKQLAYEKDLFQDDRVFKIFNSKIKAVKDFVLQKIEIAKKTNKIIGAYGAPAKAFTMFSLLELDVSVIEFCVDTTPTKIGKTFPISNIPIISEEELANKSYDMLLVTAWNYQTDILLKSKQIFNEGTELLFPLPDPMDHIV
jgi:SAM-dependent methyltransferase